MKTFSCRAFLLLAAVSAGVFGPSQALSVPPAMHLTQTGGLATTTTTTTDAAAALDATGPVGPMATTGGPFAASGVTMRSWLDLSAFPGAQTRGADIWGYTSPSGRRYGLVCFTKGTAFVEVTDPDNPSIVGYIDGGVDQVWRDVKTYQNFAYAVSDGTGVGLQIIDLSQIDNGVVTLVMNTDLGTSFNTAHNIAVNEESGYAYLVGANLAGGGIIALDLANPANPVVVGSWSGNYIHDVQVITYGAGPYAGREIAFGFGAQTGLFIVDVTDKLNMFTRSMFVYTGLSYCHQGWVNDDRSLVFIGDELDEWFGEVATTTTYVADVSDLDNPTFVTSFTNGVPATDHNLFVKGDYVYEANYASGLRIWNVSDVNNAVESGYFDSYPEHDNVASNFPGAWAAYVGFPGNVVLLNDRDRGLFLLDVTEAVGGGDPIPAISEWGLAAMALALLVVASLLYARSRAERSVRA